jgi:hypothetical protein
MGLSPRTQHLLPPLLTAHHHQRQQQQQQALLPRHLLTSLAGQVLQLHRLLLLLAVARQVVARA